MESRNSQTGNHLLRLVIATCFLLIAVAAAWRVGTVAIFALSAKTQPGAHAVVLEITKGLGPNEIAERLRSEGLISDPQLFLRLGRWMRQWKNIKAGEYQINPSMTPLQIFSIITSGVSVNRPLVIREGQNIFEIATEIELRGFGPKSRFIELCRDPRFIANSWAAAGMKERAPSTLEGYLFPDTYFLNKRVPLEEIARRMVKRFASAWSDNERLRAAEIGFAARDVITLASMIEKETGAAHERPVISSVFHNRLKKKMRLQSDPTTIYGIWEQFSGNLKKSDLHTSTPYNTYSIRGLPVGPISNPGKEAILAALYPRETEYLFFVSRNDGTHEFTRTFEEHAEAVRRFQMDPAARRGKSWRDLHTKPASGRDLGTP
ncbi:MAG: hypothetical protein A2X94_06265 [Bdellovibrionales bacterium GWB1_55_8]|nr:MAG: hypothetical protein A2X94_06265 [Bdellovibrionales bacterium GWB1_55_8]